VFGLVRRLQRTPLSSPTRDPTFADRQREGRGRDPNWSTVDPATVPYPGASGDDVIRAQHGDPRARSGGPANRHLDPTGLFYTRRKTDRVKTVDQLVELYFAWWAGTRSSSQLPPTREGLLHETDVARLSGC